MKLIKLTSLGFAALCLVMTACSDDNDEPESSNSVEPTIDKVFTEGLPASVDGATFTTNSKGQVTKIVDGDEVITFEYGSFSRAAEYNVAMSYSDKNYPGDGWTIYMQTNSQGFVSHALQVYEDDEFDNDTWDFEYNADGQLTRLTRSESDDSYEITYSNGNIVKVVESDEEGYGYEYTFNYTNSKYTKPVENKCNLMLFDDMFEIDMDEMGIAYYAGLLGKSTKNLPMACDYGDGDIDDYNWIFDSNNRPTKFWSGDDEWDVITFSWK